MIFISLGTHERPFNRLLKEIERLVKTRKIKDEIIIQRGYTDFKVSKAKSYKFIDHEKMKHYINSCDILITHGGLGCIMEGISAGKPVIAVPRRKKFNEHSDDHQLQIVKETMKYGSVIPVYDISDLGKAIQKARNLKVIKKKFKEPLMFRMIKKKLKEWEKN